MTKLSVAVYCASSSLVDEVYKNIAKETGETLAVAGYDVVYGGGHVGLMGIVADSAMQAGAHVTGVITHHLHDLEVAHQELSELHIVETMQERQKMMADKSDAFVILPGGIGTLAEFFEVVTWKQLGLHEMAEKPIIILNSNGYWQNLIDMLSTAHQEAFLRQKPESLFGVCEKVNEIPEIIEKLGVKT